jgi:hypothetical protein
MARLLPETWQKYTFKIDPPIIYEGSEEECVSHDVVLAHDEEKARQILINSYGTKFKRDYELLGVEEVTLFSTAYTNCDDPDTINIPNMDDEIEVDDENL